ncbi:MAG: Macrolide export protein MacA [Chroococcopsis gigantea SAG 12.99]|jgi:HlyD family secretion protein|nr:efflux RND transporter periplasmic adaptor subunit [Chlorogloea purpurea SAG 13.99]MDV3001264.1 Macrolide export protein MacA [Chroococcopsis gigantea SAG 12.99]
MLPLPTSLSPESSSRQKAFRWLGLPALLFLAYGCSPAVDSQNAPNLEQKAVAVDVAIAKQGKLEQARDYTGTTIPYKEISLRSRVEGQVSDITVDVGASVKQGQVLVRLDDHGLEQEVAQANAESAARQAEVASLRAEVDEARALVQRAQLELNQAKTNAARLQFLYKEGAISAQEAEIARTTKLTAEQAVRSAQQQVKNRQQAVSAAGRRVTAQNALVARAAQRQSYTTLTSPVDGSVLTRAAEPGDLAQPGNEILRLGDLSQVKIVVRISELELNDIRLGQSARVRLDAFPGKSFTGRVREISPAADPTARLIPVEVAIPNPDRLIRAGLLARVSFAQPSPPRIIVPETALKQDSGKERAATLFVVRGEGEEATVAERKVEIGERSDEQVEILSGLRAGESFVVRGGDRLKDGAGVRISFLSEKD